MLKGVTISLSVIHNKLDNLRCRIRNLDRVRLNVSNSKAPFLYLVFKVNHEQSSSFGYNIIFVSRITERILEVSRSQTIYRVDCRLQSICQILRCHLSVNDLLDIWCQLPIQHMIDFVPSFVFDADSSFHNVTEGSRKFHTEQNFCNCTMRMHRGNIQQCHISVHTRFCIDITAFSNFFSSICRFSILILVSRKIW